MTGPATAVTAQHPIGAIQAAPSTLSPFLQRLRDAALGQTVVLHTGRRSYTGLLRRVDPTIIRLEADSEEFDDRCQLEISAERIEAFEIFTS